jgi:hypothetical protein
MEGSLMPTVVAVWPNNTISILRMPSGFTMLDLFSELDAEAAPLDATCYQVSSDCDGMHITFNWKVTRDGKLVLPKSKNVRIGKICGRIKQLDWPDDILEQWGLYLTHGWSATE